MDVQEGVAGGNQAGFAPWTSEVVIPASMLKLGAVKYVRIDDEILRVTATSILPWIPTVKNKVPVAFSAIA